MSRTGFDLTVALCTHNPDPDRFRATIQGLRSQSLPLHQWQLLVIDNASTPPITLAAHALGWHPHAEVVREECLGLTAARLRAIAHAAADCIVFVDDDNILADNYLEVVLGLARSRPDLGVWGGNLRGLFAAPPEPWCDEFLEFIAVRSVSRDQWSNAIPVINVPGAGMAARTQICRTYASLLQEDSLRVALGRKGNSLMSGEDTGLGVLACCLGYSLGIFTSLELQHIIPAARLTHEYLVRLAYSTGYSDALLYSLWGVPERVSPRISTLGRIRRAFGIWRRGRQKREVIFAMDRGRKDGAAEAARLGISGRSLAVEIERAKAIHQRLLTETIANGRS